ncbi:Mur ligase [Natronomonas sp. EA1]|uniref:Mur ligase n=1 Tax=Natronomonas sp. EA1 TaxID=3421655 RepID=UPI003EB7A80E
MNPLDRLSRLFGRGERHRRVLDHAPLRISISGIRGKSSTAKRLGEVFSDRGFDTYVKITGDHPQSIHNGRVIPVERSGPRVTLYENIRLLKEFVPQLAVEEPRDAVVVENQAITEYTMRMVNETFVRPNVVVICNVRQDHNDTLGRTRQEIARSFARSVPAGVHVINGEQHGVIHEYMREEIEARGGTIEQVSVPENHRGLTAAETVHALNHVLEYVGEEPLPDSDLEELLWSIQPRWTIFENGRLFNAAKVNEIESTELFRRQLAGNGEDAELVCPFVFLRRDRRGRTASFVEYIDILAARGLIDRVHVGGAYTSVFARNVDVEAVEHDTDTETAASVLDTLLETGQPVMPMANTVHPFMREFAAEIERRAVGVSAPAPADPRMPPE